MMNRAHTTLSFLAPIALLTLPIGLTLGPAVTEPCIALLIAALLASSAVQRDWHWASRPWFLFALAWWAWLLACSLPGIAAAGIWPRWTLQALLTIRLPLCAAAIAVLLQTRPSLSRWLRGVIVLVFAYILAQLALQFLTGENLFGHKMRDNGLLTGPFDRPRAGPTLMHLFFPVLLPPVFWLLARGRLGTWAGTALLSLGVAAFLPIGQRMPVLLVGFGLTVAVLLQPVLRRTAIVAVFIASVVLAAGSIVFPPAQHRMAAFFATQMADFPNNHYGLIYTRAVAMATQHPWHGQGFAAFRTGCADSRYFTKLLDTQPTNAGGAEICVTHAHNLYLEALTDSGWPGLALFSLFALAVLITLWPRRPVTSQEGGASPPVRDPLQTALFIAALLHLWPLSAANAFTNPYMGVWFVLLLGWGLARAQTSRA